MPPQTLPGFRDFFPEQFAERAHIFDTWRRVVRRYAFVEYDGPPLEPLELYTQKSGAEIVTQLYAFTDKGGREVSLRPEMTPTFARMVGARAQALRKPVRWFSLPQLFRYERTQKGRLREHYQLNVDIVGESDVLADAELLSVAIEIMRAFGLDASDVQARVSDRQLLNGLLDHHEITESQRDVVYGVLDKLDRQPVETSTALLTAAGLSSGTVDSLLAFRALSFDDALAQYGTSAHVAPHLARFAQYLDHATALGIREWIRFDLTIVRGLAYYTGIVFELFDAKGEFRAICGGGRYDRLLAALGGADLPALGFGMGDVVLGELLRARGLLRDVAPHAADLWIVPTEGTRAQDVLLLASRLRSLEFAVEYTLNTERLERRRSGQQLQDATKARARAALVCRNDGQVELVDLRSSDSASRRTFALSELLVSNTNDANITALREALVATSAASNHPMNG